MRLWIDAARESCGAGFQAAGSGRDGWKLGKLSDLLSTLDEYAAQGAKTKIKEIHPTIFMKTNDLKN
ncbi:MAG TPA: hypothetical protein VI455_06860 [Terriglobia bacterium]